MARTFAHVRSLPAYIRAAWSTPSGPVLQRKDALFALDPEARRVRWGVEFTEAGSHALTSRLEVGDSGLLVVGYFRKELDLRRVLGIDSGTGECLWSHEVKRSVFSFGGSCIAAVTEHCTFIPQGRDGLVVDNATGEVLRTLNLPRFNTWAVQGDRLWLEVSSRDKLVSVDLSGEPTGWRVRKQGVDGRLQQVQRLADGSVWGHLIRPMDGEQRSVLLELSADGSFVEHGPLPVALDAAYQLQRLRGDRMLFCGLDSVSCVDLDAHAVLSSEPSPALAVVEVGGRWLIDFSKVASPLSWLSPEDGSLQPVAELAGKVQGLWALPGGERLLTNIKVRAHQQTDYGGVLELREATGEAPEPELLELPDPRSVFELLGMEEITPATPREILEELLAGARGQPYEALEKAICAAYRKRKLHPSARKLLQEVHAQGDDAVDRLFAFTPTVKQLFHLGPDDRLFPALQLDAPPDRVAWLLLDKGTVLCAPEDELGELAAELEYRLEDGRLDSFFSGIVRSVGYRSLAAYRKDWPGR